LEEEQQFKFNNRHRWTGSWIFVNHAVCKVIIWEYCFSTGFKFNYCRATQTLPGTGFYSFIFTTVILISSIHSWQDTQVAGVAIILSRCVPGVVQ